VKQSLATMDIKKLESLLPKQDMDTTGEDPYYVQLRKQQSNVKSDVSE
jgi:hypothetical protein